MDLLTVPLIALDQLAAAFALALRIIVGLFYSISGIHKTCVPARHKALVGTLQADGIPLARYTAWLVCLTEAIAGTCLILGLALRPAGLALLAISMTALFVDGLRRAVPAMKPLDRADFLDDVLYLPETWLIVCLVFILFAGPGFMSLDYLLWNS